MGPIDDVIATPRTLSPLTDPFLTCFFCSICTYLAKS